MAKKYGEGPNTGKKASTYEAVAADGTKLKKKSFAVHTDEAYMGVYMFEGKWFASGITSERQDWGGQIFLKATKI